ncbi:MAG: hypothetical protein K2V38_08550, partial [Gemmataceae bacterium]|nr:hypothetical protein [Gemmataceae bacterium]
MSHARRSWPWVCAAVFGLLAAVALGAVRQPGEEEDPKGGLKKRVVVDDDPVADRPSRSAWTSTPDVRLDELAFGAEEATHPAVKELFRTHAVPFDVAQFVKGNKTRVKPIPLARGERFPAQYGLQELDRDGNLLETQTVNAVEVRRYDYFEEVAVAEAALFMSYKPLGDKPGPQNLTILDQYQAAEKLMAAALRFHDYARERNIRKGRGWDEVRKPLADKLRDVRLRLLQSAVGQANTGAIRDVGNRLMAAYPKDAEVVAKVAAARVLDAKRLLKSDKHADHAKARELLDEFEANHPGVGGQDVRDLRTELTQLAQQLFARARERKAANDLGAAREALLRAVALDPSLAGVRELQRELKIGYQTLYVGVRDFPEQMSPGTARLDSERQVVELLFEGLLAEAPTADGVGYRAAAALAVPDVSPGGREFTLRPFDRDVTNRFGFEANDLVGTMKLLAARPDTWAAYPLQWLDELPAPKDTATARVSFRQGHPDPRSLFTFKLMPARWMEQKNMRLDDPGFGEAPGGTGPFRLFAVPKVDKNTAREMIFVDNPLYGRWRDRAGQPFVKEVHLLEAAKIPNYTELLGAAEPGLHILTDVPTGDLDAFRAALGNKVEVHTAVHNRRVHLLAVNHRRTMFQSKILRQGLMMALDREAILTDVFRAKKADFHKAMTGPFPPGCWATPKGASGGPPLANRDLALTRFRAYLFEPGAKAELKLSYPKDDPLAKLACE